MANQANQALDKKSYSSPVVHEYGSIQSITKAFGSNNQAKSDNAPSNATLNKTA